MIEIICFREKKSFVQSKDEFIKNYISSLRKPVLMDTMVSSFGHTVRLLELVRYFRELGIKNSFVLSLPKNTSDSLWSYINNLVKKIDDFVIIKNDENQIDLNKATDLVKESGSETHYKWILRQRIWYEILNPDVTIMGSSLLGCYWADKEAYKIGISEPMHVFPGCEDLVGFHPRLVRNNQFLRKLLNFVFAHTLSIPLNSALKHNAIKAGVGKTYTAKDFAQQHELFDDIIFPTVPSWDKLLDNQPNLTYSKYHYIGELLTKEYPFVEKNIIKFPTQNKRVLIYLGGSITDEDGTLLKRYIQNISKKILDNIDDLNIVLVTPNCKLNDLELNLDERKRVQKIEKFFPVKDLLPKVDLIITFAGHGVLNESILARKPIICLGANVDQKTHGEKAEYYGLGVYPQYNLPWDIKKRKSFYKSLVKTEDIIVDVIKNMLLTQIDYENNTIFKEIVLYQNQQTKSVSGFVSKSKNKFIF